MNLQYWKNALFCCCLFAITACSDEETVNPPAPTEIPEQPAELAEQLAQYNSDIAALQLMVDGEVEVVDYTSDEQHNYTLELSDGKIVNAALQAETDTDIPAFAINADGYWEYQLGGEKQTLTDLSGNPVPARKSLGKGTFTPQLALGEDGCWQMSLNGAHWKKLSDTPAPSLEGKTAASYSLFKSVTENEDGTLSLALSGGEMVLSIDATASSSAQAWKKFFMKSEDNVLLDYSYAGYNYRFGGMTSRYNPALLRDLKKLYVLKKKLIEQYQYNKANDFIRIELKNVLVSDVKQRILFKYGSREEIINQLQLELCDPVYKDLKQVESDSFVNSTVVKAIINRNADLFYDFVYARVKKEKFKWWIKRIMSFVLLKL